MTTKNQLLDYEKDKNQPKLSRRKKIILGLNLMFLGWLSLGIAYSEPLPGMLGEVSFYGSPILFIGGFILLITATKKNDYLNTKQMKQFNFNGDWVFEIDLEVFKKSNSNWAQNSRSYHTGSPINMKIIIKKSLFE